MRGLVAVADAIVLVSASCTSAPEIATLLVGGTIPDISGMQVVITAFTRSSPTPKAPNAATSAMFAASGGISGGLHPGSCTRGSENATPARAASWAGQAARCAAAEIPADWTPWLLLVPSATYRAKASGAVIRRGPLSGESGGGGAAISVQAARARVAPRRTNSFCMGSAPAEGFDCVPFHPSMRTTGRILSRAERHSLLCRASNPCARVATRAHVLDNGPDLRRRRKEKPRLAECQTGLRFCEGSGLPAIVRERLVRVRHAVRVFLLHRVAFPLRRGDHLGGELLRHRLLVAVARVADQPAHRQRRTALGTHFDRHLVRRATDAAALHFNDRLEVRERLLEDVHARLARTVLDEVHRGVEDPLGRALLALIHEDVDELRDGLAVVARIRQDGALHSSLAAAHFLPPLPAAAPAFGFLVPYFERLWLRPFTPDASSVPRTMW